MLDHPIANKSALMKLVLLGLLLSILPFLILTLFCHPAYDDFCNTLHQLNMSVLQRQIYLYKNFDGRYFAVAAGNLNPIRFGNFVGYKALALFTILMTFLGIFSFISALLKSNFSRLEKLIAAGFLMALFCNQVPEITEIFYFMTGSLVYQVPTILTLLFFALAIKSSGKPKRVKLLITIACCFLIAAIVGSNETAMLVLALLVFAVTINLWLDKNEQRWTWLVFSLVIVVCGAVVILAPGNAVRASLLPQGQHRFFYSLSMSLRQEVSFLLIWCSNLAFILGTLFFIPIAAGLSDRISYFKRIRLHPLIYSLLLLMLVFIGLFPAYWTMGMMAQHRTVSTVYFFFLIGWFINIVIWLNYLRRKYGFVAAKLPNYVYVVGVPLMLCTLLLANNTRTALADLARGRAYRYDKAVKERYAQFSGCARQGIAETCPVTKISDPPTTITNPYYEVEMACEKQFWKIRADSIASR